MDIKTVKPGMKVRVKSAEKLCRECNKTKVEYVLNFNRGGGMNKYCGKIYKVNHVNVHAKRIELEATGANWSWDPSALELPSKKISFKGIQ